MKILLLCDPVLSDFDLKVLQTIQESHEVSLEAALVNIKPKPGAITRIKRELRKGRGGYVVIQSFKALMQRFKRTTAAESISHLQKNFPGIRIKTATSLYQPAIYEWINEQSADCILLRGFGIIREPILSICRYGVLSYHHGDMRTYRGGPPAFWELYNNEKEIGVSIQILNNGLDTGTIVTQRFFPIMPRDTWAKVKERIYEGSTTLALQAFLILKKSGPLNNPIGETGRLYTLPDLTRWAILQMKLLARNIFK
jgi:methionyl-tRNA formyltransferase